MRPVCVISVNSFCKPSHEFRATTHLVSFIAWCMFCVKRINLYHIVCTTWLCKYSSMLELISIYKLAFAGQFFILFSVFFYLLLIFYHGRKALSILSVFPVLLLWASYAVLTVAFLLNDFSLKVVVENTSLSTPMLYKIIYSSLF